MTVTDSKVTAFRQRVDQEWKGDDTAAAWQKYYPQLKEQLAPVTQALVDAAAPRQGMQILDLASGTGEPSLSLARKVAPSGRVTATDLSPGMLDGLTRNAAAEGVANIDTKVCDAEQLPFADASFDLVTSRFGVMFFADVPAALAEISRVLKPGGSVALLVWGAPEPGTYFGAAAMPYMRRLATTPDPDGPGPMRFAEPGKLARAVAAAGFRDVQESRLSLPAPFHGSPEELLTSMMELAAPFRNAAASLSDDDRRAAREEAHRHLRPLYNGTATNVTAPIVIVTGASG
jgi:SAM-dependent methyltransferase